MASDSGIIGRAGKSIVKALPLALALSVAACVSLAHAAGGCLPNNSLLAKAKLDAFTANPASLFGTAAKGEGKLAADVRNLAATSASTMPGLATLIKAANVEQLRAIGAGLGQAALLCGKLNPDLARDIQETIVLADNPDLLASYQSVVHEQLSAALGDDQDTTASAPTLDVLGESVEGGAPNRGPINNTSSTVGGGSSLAFFAIGSSGSASRQAQTQTIFFVNTTEASALQSVSPSR